MKSKRPLNALDAEAATVPTTATESAFIRTQISLSQAEYDHVKKRAAALGISIAEFIRRAVRERLPVGGEGAWMKYAGFVETGDLHSSLSIDDLVH